MKHSMKILAALLLAFCAVCCSVCPGLADTSADALSSCFWEEKTVTGASDSFVSYPMLNGGESPEGQALAEKINAYILETAKIPAYLQLLSTVQEGSTGLKMGYEKSVPYTWDGAEDDMICAPYESLVFSARGKMLMGRPSQVYYPMTLNLKTGETVAFEDLFTDPEGAKAFIEAYLEEEIEPALSTYLENNQLFPVPYDRFFLDGKGNLILYYENSQLSFLSGDSGAVAFRYSELWDWLDTSAEGIPMQVLESPEQYGEHPPAIPEQMDEICMGAHPLYGFCMEGSLGMPVEEMRALYPPSADSEYYPGGACYEMENPILRGTLVLTDEAEATVTGILSHRVDYFGIFTGKTTLEEAKALIGREPLIELSLDETAAEMYRVCPGTLAVYSLNGELTLYADENGIVQYIGLALQ